MLARARRSKLPRKSVPDFLTCGSSHRIPRSAILCRSKYVRVARRKLSRHRSYNGSSSRWSRSLGRCGGRECTLRWHRTVQPGSPMKLARSFRIRKFNFACQRFSLIHHDIVCNALMCCRRSKCSWATAVHFLQFHIKFGQASHETSHSAPLLTLSCDEHASRTCSGCTHAAVPRNQRQQLPVESVPGMQIFDSIEFPHRSFAHMRRYLSMHANLARPLSQFLPVLLSFPLSLSIFLSLI